MSRRAHRTSKGTGARTVETNPTKINLINRGHSAAEAESANDRGPNRKDVVHGLRPLQWQLPAYYYMSAM